ncbi:nuclear protein DGCR14 [Crucibulum laeve]|uniref:Nuclear protein DGCR14 n=1 Tax=Crucibulum laeve TaxID=68775 RepID=A0A5C3M8M5_9AGAR|nr:nuclear protein DGCR14 [Crucibulum laeve]
MSDSASTSAPERSLNRQVVLEEDEYTAALSQIIARDFFPSLVHLDATNEYLDALQSRDPHLIGASVRRLEEISYTPATSTRRRAPHQTPSQTPYGLTPSLTPARSIDGEPLGKRPRFDSALSLDEFQARYTSEDNSSFTHILDEENRKRKEKWNWAWDAQRRVEAQRGKMLEGRERMLIDAPPMTGVREKFAIEAPVPAGLITGGGDDRVAEDNSEETADLDREMVLKGMGDENNSEIDVMAAKKDSRSASVDGWNFKTRNSLMFAPDADESPYHSKPSVDLLPEPKVIKYGNTRLPEQDQTSSSRSASEPPSPTRSRIDAAITGTPYRPKSPTQNGFSLVPSVPSPTPSELGPVAMKQLMTWGTLQATPRIISKFNDPHDAHPPSTPFHLPDISSREAISHKLSNKASKSLRAKAGLLGLGATGHTPGVSTPGRKGSMAPPSWTPRRSEAAGNLTPAARRLLERSTMGTAAVKRAEAMERKAAWDSASKGKERELNQVRWTPTPSPITRR